MQTSNTSKVLALSSGKAITSVMGILTAMILTRILSVHDYSTYRQTLLVFNLILPILTLGLPDAIYYFLGNEKERKRGLLNDNLLLLFIMGSLYAIFIWAGGNQLWANRFNNPDLVRTLGIFAPYAVFTLPLATISAAMVVQNKIPQLTIFNIVSRIFLFIFVVLAAWLFKDVFYIVSAEVLSASLVFVSLLILVYRYVPNDRAMVRKDSMLTILKYSIPLGLAGMLGTLSNQLNQAIVSSICSTEQYAIYANGTTELPVIPMVTGSIAIVILVQMRQFIAANNISSALDLFRKAATKSAPILIPLMFFLQVMAVQFIEFVYSDKYLESVDIFRIFLLILPARIVYYSSALLAFGLSRLILFRSLISLILNLALTLLLTHLIGLKGAIISYITVVYLWDISYNFIILSRKFGCPWYELLPLKYLLKVVLISAITCLITVPVLYLPLHFTIQLGLAALLYLGILFPLFRRFDIVDVNLSSIRKMFKA
jgi:O-antigen/teichoic acid export membrane protein